METNNKAVRVPEFVPEMMTKVEASDPLDDFVGVLLLSVTF